MGEANFRGTPAASWPSPTRLLTAMAVTYLCPTSAHDRSLLRSLGGTEVKFQIGDKVKLGSTRIGTITDVGTVLIQVKTSEGSLRVVCPWEVVRILG
jgi:hypothetical protein